MSALNHTAPRFRSHHSNGQLSGGASASAIPFAQALDVPPRLVAASLVTPNATPLATPLAPPPPPPVHLTSSQSSRHSVRYAGVDHTLGPVFSEEEDGDDSDFIAAKMASLGIDPHSASAQAGSAAQFNILKNQNGELQRRIRAQQILQLQILQQQQQQQAAAVQAATLQSLLQSNDPQQLREAMALVELQRAQLATGANGNLDRLYQAQQQPQLLAQQRLHMQQQLLALQIQQQQQQQMSVALGNANGHGHGHSHSHSHGGQRHSLAAQLEAGTLRREREREQRSRPLSTENPHAHSRLRAAFESAPGAAYFPPLSPPVDSAAGVGWTSTLKSPGAEWPASAWTVTSVPQRSSSSGSNSTSARAPSPPTPAAAAPPPPPPVAQPQLQSFSSQRLGRFARAKQDFAAAQAAAPGAGPLAALLSRRRAKPTEEDAAPSTSSFPDTGATSPLSESYHGRPHEREWSNDSGRKVASESGHTALKEPASYFEWGFRLPAPRSQSFSVAYAPEERPLSYIMRQPYGPPGSPDELKAKNFASSIRRQAGLNLGMLNRRHGLESSE